MELGSPHQWMRLVESFSSIYSNPPEPSWSRGKLFFLCSILMTNPAVCIVRLEYVWLGSCAAVSVRVLYPGVHDRCEGSTHPFANGNDGHPLSLLRQGRPPFVVPDTKKVGRREGSTLKILRWKFPSVVPMPIQPLFELHIPPPGRLQYTPFCLDLFVCSMRIPDLSCRGRCDTYIHIFSIAADCATTRAGAFWHK